MTQLPKNYPLRIALNDEVHARPPEQLKPPMRISYLALLTDWPPDDRDLRPVNDLAKRYGAAAPAKGARHFSADLGPFRLKWERHTEFARYKFMVPGGRERPFAKTAIESVPADWLAKLKGETIVAAHAALADSPRGTLDNEQISSRFFAGNPLVGARLGGGAATAFTDFRIHGDGFSRVLIYDRSMTERQAGRYVQRLLEIETYRVLALLALPVAQRLGPELAQFEKDLTRVTDAIAAGSDQEEHLLLDHLTELAAAIENRCSDTQYRFSATGAYYDLVRGRIDELRETRIEGLQTFGEFIQRRFVPAITTCESVAKTQSLLSDRVAHATQLLSTRVDIVRQRQNQALLESMNRRARLQLRLQQTVEGLSIAAVTYYVVSLVAYAAKSGGQYRRGGESRLGYGFEHPGRRASGGAWRSEGAKARDPEKPLGSKKKCRQIGVGRMGLNELPSDLAPLRGFAPFVRHEYTSESAEKPQ